MSGGSNEPPLALIALFPLAFAAFWAAICFALTRFSGWLVLQQAYPDREDVLRNRLCMQSLSLGGAFGMPVNYNRCVTIDVCMSGLRLRVWPMFGMFQRPVFIPWTDIAASEKKVLFLTATRLTFTKWPGGEVTMSKQRWQKVAPAGLVR